MFFGLLKKIHFLAIATAIMLPVNLLAQLDSSIKKLEEVVVTANRKATKDINTPYIVESLSDKQIIANSSRTAPEALMATNGIFVQKTNHGGGSPFVRALTGNQTLILVDGIRLNNSIFRFGPNQYLNSIDAFSIGKMEVAKGTGAVQYGSDAMGGVIQVFTKDPLFNDKPVWKGRALAKYMTGDMEKTVRGELNYASKNTTVLAGATYRNFGDLIGGDTTRKQSPSGYKEFAFDVKVKGKWKDNMRWTIAHQQVKQFDVPIYHKIVLENFKQNQVQTQQRLLSYASLSINNKGKWINEIVLTASLQQSMEKALTQKNNDPILRIEKIRVNTGGFTASIISQINHNWVANSGIDIYVDKVNCNRQEANTLSNQMLNVRGLYPDNARYRNFSVYSLHHLQFNKWKIDVGARMNVFAIRLVDSTLGNVSINPGAIVGNAALLYNFSMQDALFISYSTGYRAPNINDMGTLGIVDFRYELPTAGLSPEQSKNIEIGYKLRNKQLSISASVYYMHLQNIIARVRKSGESINGYPIYKKENIEKAFIRGAEVAFDWKLTEHWNVAGSFSYNYGQNLTKREPMQRIPPLNSRLTSGYKKRNCFISAELLFAAKQSRLAQADKDDNRITKNGTPGWKVMNCYGGYAYRKWNIIASLQNIFNGDYRLHGSGINGVGRSLSLSIDYSF
jgi:hemoglobin/transferrin/lactoferrin receptor protein